MDLLTNVIDQPYLFLLIAGCLGACFGWGFWEIEQARVRRRQLHRSTRLQLLGWKR